MNRFEILKNPDISPYFALATPEEKKESSRNTGIPTGTTVPVDPSIRNSIIDQYLATSRSRQFLADSMVNPIQQRMNYNNLARRILHVNHLPDGALPIIANTNNPIHYVDERYNVRESNSTRFIIPTFEILAHSEIPIGSLRQNPLDLIQRSQDLIINNIKNTEDATAIGLLRAASIENLPVAFNSTDSIRSVLQEAFSSIETNNLRVSNIFMNAHEYSLMRLHLRDDLYQQTSRILINTGVLGNLWGVPVIASRAIPLGEIFITAQSEYVGQLPIRRDITVVSADDPINRSIGWFVSEEIGMVCQNPRAVIRIITDDWRQQPSTSQDLEPAPSFFETSLVQEPAFVIASPPQLPLYNRFQILNNES
jgi:hypothetical protein